MPLLSSPHSSPSHRHGESSSGYSAVTGLIYVFNVIVGTGALAIPHMFPLSGTLLSTAILLLLAFVSFITVTFMVEAMSISNAVMNSEPVGTLGSSATEEEEDPQSSEDDPLLVSNTNAINGSQQIVLSQSCFDMTRTLEMGHMAKMYFSRTGVVLFYLTIVVYLYGDLGIYAAVVSKSLRDLTCSHHTHPNDSSSPIIHHNSSDPCFPLLTPNFSRSLMYRTYCTLFLVLLGPFAFCQMTHTKYLQLVTTVFRWTAFTTMITIAIIKIATSQEPPPTPPLYNMTYTPQLFGIAIYSFMCHHSIPSLVTPIRNKKSLQSLFLLDYFLIYLFYILLSLTGSYAFFKIQDIYTLNFLHEGQFISILLPLFPVFTLSTNFPIIAITLRNNLHTLFNYDINLNYYTLLAIIPPYLISLCTENVGLLVGVTGGVSGVGIQYFVPCFLVYKARKVLKNNVELNPYKSWFRGGYWVWGVVAWGVVGGVAVVRMQYLEWFGG